MLKIGKNKKVFLIRAYNESFRIQEVLEKILQAGYTQIVVVDDGSTDATFSLLQTHFEGKIFLLRHICNRGAGAALATGFAYIEKNAQKFGWEYVITFDADGQMDISDMKNFEECLCMHPDAKVIYGSRFVTKTDSNIPWWRWIILQGGRVVTFFFSGIWLTDAHNGYRMIALSLLPEIHITMDGMEYASELIDEIQRHKITIHEVPVHISYDAYTLGKGQRYGGPIRIFLRMFYKKFFD